MKKGGEGLTEDIYEWSMGTENNMGIDLRRESMGLGGGGKRKKKQENL